MMYVNNELKHSRRTDLEDSDLEIIWQTICCFKSKRSPLFCGIYRPSKEQDDLVEKNMELAYLLNCETITTGDLNIDYLKQASCNKHPLRRAVSSINFKQLVTMVTRPRSGTCLEHVYTNFQIV